MQNKRLLFLVNVDWFFLSHRLPIALAAKNQGWEVLIATANSGRFPELHKYGFATIEVPFERSGTRVFTEILLLVKLIRLYRKLHPNVVHHVALKASLYGSVAARFSKIPLVINALSGLGFLFTDNRSTIAKKLVLGLMRFGFASAANRFIFQNPDDLELLSKKGLVNTERSSLIKGSGVDLHDFGYSLPIDKPLLHIVLPARMLKDKGVIEFVRAARLAKTQLQFRALWILCGGIDDQNPSSLSFAELKALEDPGYIAWIGHQSNMQKVYNEADVIVLPSYREGMPKALIEACAIGRPIITTDAPGCRLCVNEGINGHLVPVYDYELLAKKVIELVNHRELRLQMGQASRALAETEFSIQHVVDQTLELYNG